MMCFRAAVMTCLLVSCLAWSARPDFSGDAIQPDVNTHWGDWGVAEWCPHGTFAQKFDLKVEGKQEKGDDTALNTIALLCQLLSCDMSTAKSPRWIHSKENQWGDYTGERQCPAGYVIVGAQAKSEPDTINSDDTAANGYNFRCRLVSSIPLTYPLYGNSGPWGTWSAWKECPQGTGVCGLKTRVEDDGGSDDTALNDAIFYCCTLPAECMH